MQRDPGEKVSQLLQPWVCRMAETISGRQSRSPQRFLPSTHQGPLLAAPGHVGGAVGEGEVSRARPGGVLEGRLVPQPRSCSNRRGILCGMFFHTFGAVCVQTSQCVSCPVVTHVSGSVQLLEGLE